MSNQLVRALFLSWLLLGARICTAEPELVNIQSVDPTIVVELRYASARNFMHRPIYPANMPALSRLRVAQQLADAQALLRPKDFRLKIWDAYRPKSAHDQLWQLSPISDYVADPQAGGSLHTWGVAIDATLVDKSGREVKMPTDFDDFTPAAWLRYGGTNSTIRRNLLTLQAAMARSGFYGMRTEWWHFVTKEWKDYKAVPEVNVIRPAAPPAPPASTPSAAPVARASAVTRSSSPPNANNPAGRSLR